MVSTGARTRKNKSAAWGALTKITGAEPCAVHSAVKEDEGIGATNPVAVVSTQRKKRKPGPAVSNVSSRGGFS